MGAGVVLDKFPDAWGDIGGAASGGVGSGAGIGSLLGLASGNPYVAGFQALGSIFGGGSVKVSKAGAGGEASSGAADYSGENALKLNKSLLDFSEPVKVAIMTACVVGAIYIYKKHLR